jgi:hypothetical protein
MLYGTRLGSTSHATPPQSFANLDVTESDNVTVWSAYVLFLLYQLLTILSHACEVRGSGGDEYENYWLVRCNVMKSDTKMMTFRRTMQPPLHGRSVRM